MELHQLKVERGLKRKKRVGRGGKRGTYSGRGVKGQKARAGTRYEPIIRPLIKRYHKLKGESFVSAPRSILTAEVNLDQIEKNFESGATVNPETLREKGLIGSVHRKLPTVKILGRGKLTKELIFEKCSFSESARQKISEAKGKISAEIGKRGKKTKKQLTPEQIKERQEMARRQADKRRAAKKKAADKRKKEARKKGKKK